MSSSGLLTSPQPFSAEWHLDGRLKRIAKYASDKLIREELDPPGTCPLLTGDGKRHLDARDLDDW